MDASSDTQRELLSPEPDRRKAALYYGTCLGERVIPLYTIKNGVCTCSAGPRCDKPGKHPIIENWQVYASSNPHRIRTWFNRDPAPNIGLLQGWITDALDVDDLAALAVLEAQIGRLPETVVQFTRRGRHYLFKKVAGLGNDRGMLPPGIDFRGERGFIVGAPSLHPDGIYCWDKNHHRLRHPIAELPVRLIELIRQRPAPADRAHTSWSEFLARDCLERVDGRNTSLTRLMGYLLSHAHRPEEAREIAALWTLCRAKPPLDDAEFTRTADSMIARHLRTTQGG